MLMEEEPLLFTNATFLTMGPEHPRAEALLARDGRIAAIGARADVERHARRARVVDLEDQIVIPGFNDSHCHILSFGLDLGRVDVSPERATSIEEIERLVSERAEQTAQDEWIQGRGYNQHLLVEERHPTREELDRAAPGRPVVLWHTSGHVLTASSRALELAGISQHTASPSGGEIERDERGRPTGLLKEAPAMNLLADAIPRITHEEGRAAIIRAMQAMARQGITSASDAATGRDDLDAELRMYRDAAESGNLPGRITLMPQIVFIAPPGSDTVTEAGDLDVGKRQEWLRVGPTKIFSDGAMSTLTAALREPYEGTDTTGILIWEPDVLDDMVGRAHRAGWQIAVHAIGDRAIEVVLDAYAKALERTPRSDHRHRIEHCMMADSDLVERMHELGVLPSLQPDIFRLGDGYITALGIDRASQLIPVALFKRLGVPVAFSSDRPVVPGDPLACILDAMERRTPAGVVLGPEHRVSAEDAIWSYTAGGAHVTHTERSIGRLKSGMLADLAVLSRDPARVPAESFDEVKVTMTVAGGRIVYTE